MASTVLNGSLVLWVLFSETKAEWNPDGHGILLINQGRGGVRGRGGKSEEFFR
jgi:hypothetical protein